MNIIKQNQLFFILFGVFIVIGAIFLFVIEQGDAIFFFSERRSDPVNYLFIFFTRIGEEWAYPVLLAFLLFAVKPMNFRNFIYIPLLGTTVALVSYLSKAYFRHPRPMLYFDRKGILDEIVLVSDVSLYGGLNSFPSGHTMSGFALYAFVAFVYPNKKIAAAILFFIALMVGLSRIYLVQHFLKDVYLGAIIGVFIGMLWYYLKVSTERKWPIKKKTVA